MQIEVKNITKRIKKETVLERVSCRLQGGTIYGIYGRNGSGKTMFLRCLSGIVRTDEGEIRCGDKLLHRDMDILPDMGLLIENVSLWGGYSGFENLKMLASIRGKIDDARIAEVMERLELDPSSGKAVRKYSLGMRQKLAIAQAVMEYPEVILLDEPTNALDEGSVEQVRQMLRQEKERGALIVLASHNQDDLRLLCDIRLHMKNGHLEEAE